jgi:hydroxyethylthiazole kinase-like uncharacterized protein yjeF
MAGAPFLAGLGALRAGAGLVRVAVPAPVQATVAGYRPEALTAGLPSSARGSLAAGAAREVRRLCAASDALVLGPGAGRAPSTLRVLRALALGAELPLVLDADGLAAFAGRAADLRRRKAPTVLTPHEGEAARLLETEAATLRRDRVAAAARLALAAGAVVALKGPGTVVTDGRRVFVAETGGPVLASGGTGDVLAGAVAAFLAARPDRLGTDAAFEAACGAVHVHGLAADAWAAEVGDRGVLAGEVADAIPRALARWLGTGRR